MTAITAPSPVTTAPRQMSKATRREMTLVRKRFNTPACFTEDDQRELERLQLVAARAAVSDLAHDVATEARSWPETKNIHDR
jgi:hypothetical protein